MRQIVRYCASCYRNGRRTELPDTGGEVVIIINQYGAHTDLCPDCQETVLGPLLDMMSSGDNLNELTRAEWAQLGSTMPSSGAALRRKPAAKATTASPKTAGSAYVCDGCGQTFTRASSLETHRRSFGSQPHDRPKRYGAAAGKAKTSAGSAYVAEAPETIAASADR